MNGARARAGTRGGVEFQGRQRLLPLLMLLGALAGCLPQEAPVVASAAAPAPARPRPAPPPTLQGMGSAELIALLGAPDLRRKEPPAELWQYRSADCVLDLFLYSDSGPYRVVRVETRNRSPWDRDPQRCGEPFRTLPRQAADLPPR